MPADWVTGRIRSAVARADSGSVVDSPNAVRPGATRSMSVPSESSSARRSARLDDEIPTTATIAAIPIAIPSAVRVVRNRRDRSPMVPTRNRSLARSRLDPTRSPRTGGSSVGVRTAAGWLGRTSPAP